LVVGPDSYRDWLLVPILIPIAIGTIGTIGIGWLLSD
jgi:hypothetical protein